jgi:hypothetical protein
LASTTNGRNEMIPTIASGGVLFDGKRGPLLLLLINLLDELECVLMAMTSMTMTPLNWETIIVTLQCQLAPKNHFKLNLALISCFRTNFLIFVLSFSKIKNRNSF